MQRRWLFVLLALPLTLAGCGDTRPVYGPPPPPPPELSYQEVHDLGFRDGFNAARHDIETNQPPGPPRHERFRNPPVPPPAWEDYRRAFREGYQAALHPNGPPPGP